MSNVVIKIEIPRDLLQTYEQQARRAKKQVEDIIVHRLEQCKWHTSLNPIYLDDDFRGQIEAILSKSIKSAKDLVDYLANTQSLRLTEGIKISLPDSLMKRLVTRTFGHPVEKVIVREALKGLETYVGLR